MKGVIGTRLAVVVGAILLAFGHGAASPAAASPRFAYPWPDHSVIPILFVPTDWSVDSAEVRAEAAALRTAMTEIRAFYAQQNADWTFRPNDLEVVQGRGARSAYHVVWNGRNIYEDGVEFDGNMEHEVVSELHSRGYPTPPAQDESGYSVLIFVKGAGGWAGGREFPEADGGWAILGDWAIDSIAGELDEGDYWWSGRRLQIGAAAHELGHTFDLPHPDAHGGAFDGSIMGAWWDYPAAGLSDWERDRLATGKAPFFTDRAGLPTTTTEAGVGDLSADPGGTIEAVIRRGSARSLRANDGDQLVLGQVASEDGYAGTVYLRFGSVSNMPTRLRIEVRDRATARTTRSIEIHDERYGWVTLASEVTSRREIAADAVTPAGPATVFVSGISGSGDVQLRVRYLSSRRSTIFIDELTLDEELLAAG